MNKQKNKIYLDKKGISPMIAYILLVVFAIIIGAIVFQWLETFVPAENLQCPEGTSILISEATLNSSNSELKVRLRNNGRFNIVGYFIHITNESEEELPTIDISDELDSGESSGNPINSSGAIFFRGGQENPFSPGGQELHIFDLSGSGIGTPYLLSITPTRQQEHDGVSRLVSCGRSRRTTSVEIV
ncbi:MAG: hypothetical protein WDZ62_02545 [Candidatus Pacearchaeota archaeon]